jgi:FkbM family methyltransferase
MSGAVVRHLHLHRIVPAWKRSRKLAPTRAGLMRIWWTLALGFVERYVPVFRSNRLHVVNIATSYGSCRLYLRANAWDTFTFYEIFLKEVYRAALPLPAAATIVDLGGNIGLASAYFATHSPDCDITVVEPDPDNQRILERNLEGTRARILEAAIAGTRGTAALAIGASVRHHLVREGELPTGTRPVKTLTLDDVLDPDATEPIDVLKVDIEGAEADAFAEPSRALKRVKTVIMEMHAPEEAAGIKDSLEAAGFRHEARPASASRFDVPDVFRRWEAT